METWKQFRARQHEQTTEYLKKLMSEAGDNVIRASIMSGVNRTHLHRLLVQHGLRAYSPAHARGNEAWQELRS